MTASQPTSDHSVIPKELSLPRLLAFALPALPVAAFQLPFVILVPKFYADNVGLSLTAVGVIIAIVRLMDALLDPMVGYLADTTRVKWGRRRTWCAVAAIPTTVGAFFVFNPFPNVAESNSVFWGAWFFIWSMMLSVGYTAISLSHLSWGAEVSLNYYGRNRIFAAREVLAVIGTLVATALPWILSRLGFHGDATVLIVLSALVVVSLPLFVIVMVTFVPEPPHVHQQHHNFFEGLKGLWANEHFMRLLGAYALGNMGNAVPATLLLYFARDYVHAGEDAQRFFLLLYFLCGVLSTPIWMRLSRATSKHRAWCTAMLVACAGFIWTPFIGYDFLGSWSPYAFGVIMAIAGVSVGADLMLPVSMQADVIDVDTARTGEQHTGFYFASWALANKIALSIALGFGFVALGLAGFDKGGDHPKPPVAISAPATTSSSVTPTAEQAQASLSPRNHVSATTASDEPVQQTPFAIWTLVLLYGVVPIVLKLGAVSLVWNFPIGAKEQEKLREAIEAQILRDAEQDGQLGH